MLQGRESTSQQSNDNQNSDMPNSLSGNTTMPAQIHKMLSGDDLSKKIRSLNAKQRQVFDFMYNWAKSYITSKLGNAKQLPVLFYLFLLDSRGCVKSHLTKTIYHSVNKLFLYQSGNLDKLTVLPLVPTDAAAINIDQITIYSGLNIPCREKLTALSDQNRAELQNKYFEIQIIIIDEISMVFGKLFYEVHQRLNEIFSSLQYAILRKVSASLWGLISSYFQFKQNQCSCSMKEKQRKVF